jgi:hypothetical protein
MLEIIILWRMWHRIGHKAQLKGASPLKYQLLLILLWFGGEFVGGFLAVFVTVFLYGGIPEGGYSLIIDYILAIALAVFGVWYVFNLVENLPEPAVRPPDPDTMVATPEAKMATPGNPLPAAPPGAITADPSAHPPIPLDPSAAPKPGPAPAASVAKKDTEQEKDTIRELIETIVFVVVLVLMLKTFLAEAFVIPTGSMADTLLGYHYKETCKDCRYPNLINASAEAEPQNPRAAPRITEYKCTNCGKINTIQDRRGGQP